jgi:hypothetical protein
MEPVCYPATSVTNNLRRTTTRNNDHRASFWRRFGTYEKKSWKNRDFQRLYLLKQVSTYNILFTFFFFFVVIREAISCL